MSDDEAAQVWAKTLEQVREKSGKAQDSQLCAAIRFLKSTENTVTVTVPSRYHRDQLETRGYIQQLQDALRVLSGADLTLEVLLDVDGGAKSVTPRKIASPATISPSYEPALPNNPGNTAASHRLNPDFTFETFVIGDNNVFACNAAKAVAANPGKTYNPLLIYGGVGLGKTHLMHAIGNVLAKDSGRHIICVTAEEFTNEFIASISQGDKKGPPAFRKKYREADTVLIDDIHFFQKTETVQEELFNTFEALYRAKKAIVFTCDRPINELKNINERLRSRFSMGLTTNLDIPAYEVRKAILEKTLSLQNKVLPAEIIEFLAQNIASNIRDLKGALSSVLGHAEITHQKPSIDIARKFLIDSYKPAAEHQITIEQVQRAVAEHFHLAITDLKSKKRTQNIAQTRHIAMYIAKELTGASDTEIGSEFNGRDASTVNHSRGIVEDACNADGQYDETIKVLIRRIRENTVITK